MVSDCSFLLFIRQGSVNTASAEHSPVAPTETAIGAQSRTASVPPPGSARGAPVETSPVAPAEPILGA